jgi:predicted transcriptional regulator
MSEMPDEQKRGHEAAASGGSSSNRSSAAHRTITIDLDRKLDERLGWLARWQRVSEQDLLAEAIEQHPKRSEQRSLTVQVSDAAAARLAAAAATLGMSVEELIAEAIDTYSPTEKVGRFWTTLGFPGLLVALGFVLMFASPPVDPSGSAVVWTLFAAAMVVGCCAVALVLVTTVIYPEWMVIKYRIAGLVSASVCGAVAVLSVFAYVYWLLSNVVPASFNLPLGRVDAVYFALGTFTTTGTGRFVAQSSLAEMLVSCQVVLGWGFVAVLLALLVPRAAAAHKSRSTGRIVVRLKSSR